MRISLLISSYMVAWAIDQNCTGAVRPVDDVKLLREQFAKAKHVRPAVDSSQCRLNVDAPDPNSTAIDIAFLAFGGPFRVAMTTGTIHNIEATTRLQTRFHIVVDLAAEAYLPFLCSDPRWRGLLLSSRLWLHSLRKLPPRVSKLHAAIARTATGHGRTYLFKNLLHMVVPKWLKRVLFVDADLFFFDDVANLWALWREFQSGQIFAMALEQNPAYAEIHALGGRGFNSGVLMMHLQAMRESKLYARLLEGYSQTCKGCKITLPMPQKKKKLGWVADQTLFSLMSTPAAGGGSLFYTLPCGWNRQTSTAYLGGVTRDFHKWHRCDDVCHVIHGNEWESKKIVASMHQDASGASAHQVWKNYRCTLHPFDTRGSGARRMWNMVAKTCFKSPAPS